jgi:osmotically-inducible protein OsmY
MSAATREKTDKQLQHDVLAELRYEPRINAAQIGVAAQDGVVTLTGEVTFYREKLAAERAAKRVAGVHAVVNEIKVVRSDDERLSDENIAEAALHALKWNILVPSKNITVSVSDGWVTLEGEVRWQFQKTAAEEAVRYLEAVTGVTNHIRVRPRASPDSVKEGIEAALKRNAEVDAQRITVTVDGSKVMLRGIVTSFAEREEAERAAWAAPGVSEVVNLIIVSRE